MLIVVTVELPLSYSPSALLRAQCLKVRLLDNMCKILLTCKCHDVPPQYSSDQKVCINPT